MFIITFNEHLELLQLVGTTSPQGTRTGKNGGEAIQVFEKQKDAEQWCKECQKRWCPATEKDEEVLTFWYEIWNYPILKSVNDSRDANFVAAYNRFGKKIDATWTIDGYTALRSEPKKRKRKVKVRKAARKVVRGKKAQRKK